MNEVAWFEHGFALFLVVVACVAELKTTKISNKFPIVGLCLAGFFSALDHRPLLHVEGFLAALAFGVWVYKSGELGGGAVKLFAALGAMLGLWELPTLAVVLLVTMAIAWWLGKRRGQPATLPTGPFFILGVIATTLVAHHDATKALLPPHV